MCDVGYKDKHPGGHSHCGLTVGPVRAKEGQSKNFEKYPQMVVSIYKNPHMVVHETEIGSFGSILR